MPHSSDMAVRLPRTLKRLFFASGATGLVYESVFVKVFGYTFGTTAYAIATVLAAFMVGLALGACLVGRIASRIRHPLRLYAVLELLIGIFCVLTPLWHNLVTRAYVSVYGSLSPSPATLTLLQFALASAVVLVPSTLMGATLPAILKSALARDAAVASETGAFYSANLAGAAAGTFLATFLLLPWTGIYGTLILAASVNVFIFLRCWRMTRIVTETVEPEGEPSPSAVPAFPFPLAAGIAAFSGLSSLAYENLFSHIFALLIGSSVYAFGTMLFTFLIGLALGSRITLRCLRRGLGPAALSWSLLLPPLLLAVTVPLYDRIDGVYALVGKTAPSFLVMEATRFAICLLLLLPPATGMGMVFPLCMELAAGSRSDAPRRIGLLYAVNTLASVAGSLLAGFVLISWIGSERALYAVGVAGIVVAVGVLAWRRPSRGETSRFLAASALTLALPWLLPRWDPQRLTSGRWVYFTSAHHEDPVVHFEEDVHGGFTTVTQKNGVRTLWSNGKFQGNNGSEMGVQHGLCVYPVLFLKKFDRALNVGFGTGVTAGVIGRFPFREIDVAEIAPSILRASEHFREENRDILRDPRVRTHIVDGRNHLLLHERTYDLISVEISSVWIAGAANLYNVEFYDLCRRRLNPGGVFQQWVQLHHIDTFDLLMILNTLKAAFRNCALFRADHQGILVASDDPLVLDLETLRAHDRNPATEEFRRHLPGNTLLAYAGDLLLSPDDYKKALEHVVDRLGNWKWIFQSRDFWPVLEYATPKGNALRFALEANVGYVERFARNRMPSFRGEPTRAELGAILERRGEYGAALVQYEKGADLPGVRERIEWLRALLERSGGGTR